MSHIIHKNQASSAFQRWQLQPFDAPPPAPEPPPPEPEPIIEAPPEPDNSAIEIAPGVQLPTAEDVERIQQEAWKEGYDAGYEEGSARGRMEAAELHQMVQALDNALTNFDQEVAEDIQALAIEIARQVVRDTLAVKSETILSVVREALINLPQQAATVRVNPVDGDILRRYLADQYESIGHRVVEDETIMQGGCLVESSGAQIDAQVQTRWRRVVENMTKSASEFLDE